MDTNTHKSGEESFENGNSQTTPPPYTNGGSGSVSVPNTEMSSSERGNIPNVPPPYIDTKHTQKTGCLKALIIIAILVVAIILGSNDHPLGAICMSVIGVILGIVFVVSMVKGKAEEQKKQEAFALYKQNCIDKALCEKTLNAVASNLPLEYLDAEYATKTADEKEMTLNSVFYTIIQKSMEDGIITDEEENGINHFISHFKIDISSISTKSVEDKQMQEIYKKHNIKVPDNINTLYDKYVKLLVIKDLLNGILPHRKNVECGGYYLNLDKDEQIIWDFSSCSYFQEVTTTTYVSKHSGGSMRIAKGIYMRSGSTKTTPIKETEMKEKANGTLFIGTKNLYFYSATKTVKIPYKKVVSFTPYSDGLGLQKDGDNSKPQAFKGIDGWFAYNVVTNIQNLEA